MERTSFPVHSGSTKSDVMGNIKLDDISDLPTIPSNMMKDYFGSRYVLASGKADTVDSEENDPEESDEDAQHDDGTEIEIKKDKKDGKESEGIIAIHALPTSVITDLMTAYEVKHLVDMWPTPMNLAKRVISMGGSYVGVCHTPEMKQFLFTRAFNDILVAKVTPTERLLYDARFTSIFTSWYGGPFKPRAPLKYEST